MLILGESLYWKYSKFKKKLLPVFLRDHVIIRLVLNIGLFFHILFLFYFNLKNKLNLKKNFLIIFYIKELVDVILQFDTTIDTNLIKTKLLIYIAHVKNEYLKLYNKNLRNDSISMVSSSLFGLRKCRYSISISENFTPSDDLTIKTCILINNFQKSIELLDDIEHKLNAKSNSKTTSLDTSLQSIVDVLEENIEYMVEINTI